MGVVAKVVRAREAQRGARHRGRGRLVRPVRDGALRRDAHLGPGLVRGALRAGGHRRAHHPARRGARGARGHAHAARAAERGARRSARRSGSGASTSSSGATSCAACTPRSWRCTCRATCRTPACRSRSGMTALALIGFGNIFGSYGAGWLGGRASKKWLLTWIYGLRCGADPAAACWRPRPPFTMYTFAFGMGLLWLSTVPLTQALVAQIFGVQATCRCWRASSSSATRSAASSARGWAA